VSAYVGSSKNLKDLKDLITDYAARGGETFPPDWYLLPNNQRQHRTSARPEGARPEGRAALTGQHLQHAPKDVLPLREEDMHELICCWAQVDSGESSLINSVGNQSSGRPGSARSQNVWRPRVRDPSSQSNY